MQATNKSQNIKCILHLARALFVEESFCRALNDAVHSWCTASQILCPDSHISIGHFEVWKRGAGIGAIQIWTCIQHSHFTIISLEVGSIILSGERSSTWEPTFDFPQARYVHKFLIDRRDNLSRIILSFCGPSNASTWETFDVGFSSISLQRREITDDALRKSMARRAIYSSSWECRRSPTR